MQACGARVSKQQHLVSGSGKQRIVVLQLYLQIVHKYLIFIPVCVGVTR